MFPSLRFSLILRTFLHSMWYLYCFLVYKPHFHPSVCRHSISWLTVARPPLPPPFSPSIGSHCAPADVTHVCVCGCARGCFWWWPVICSLLRLAGHHLARRRVVSEATGGQNKVLLLQNRRISLGLCISLTWRDGPSHLNLTV